LLTQYTFQSTK